MYGLQELLAKHLLRGVLWKQKQLEASVSRWEAFIPRAILLHLEMEVRPAFERHPRACRDENSKPMTVLIAERLEIRGCGSG